jgi:hypothetical protein
MIGAGRGIRRVERFGKRSETDPSRCDQLRRPRPPVASRFFALPSSQLKIVVMALSESALCRSRKEGTIPNKNASPAKLLAGRAEIKHEIVHQTFPLLSTFVRTKPA